MSAEPSYDWVHYATDMDGTRRYMRISLDGQTIEYRRDYDVAPALEQNLAMRNHNDGYSQSREMRRAAHIPAAIIDKWLTEEGWDCRDPRNADRLHKKLIDPDWAYLRTADGRLSLSNGVIR